MDEFLDVEFEEVDDNLWTAFEFILGNISWLFRFRDPALDTISFSWWTIAWFKSSKIIRVWSEDWRAVILQWLALSSTSERSNLAKDPDPLDPPPLILLVFWDDDDDPPPWFSMLDTKSWEASWSSLEIRSNSFNPIIQKLENNV